MTVSDPDDASLIDLSAPQTDAYLPGEQIASAAADFTEDSIRIPVIEEQFQVRTEVIETGRMRLVKTVETHDETVSTPLMHEELDMARVAINQYVDSVPPTRQEGETTIYPVVRKAVVVEKRLLLVEEIYVTKRITETVDTQTVSLRCEPVTVDRNASSSERPA